MQHKKGETAPFTNQFSLQGNLLVDDIEVKSAQGNDTSHCILYFELLFRELFLTDVNT